MKARLILGCLLIVTIFILMGCNNRKMKQTGNEDTSDGGPKIVNNDATTNETNDINENKTDISIQDNTSKEFTRGNIKEFLLYADALADNIIYKNTSSDKVIGKYDSIDVFEIIGEYDTFDKVKQLIGDYYTDEVIEMELQKRYLANLYGKIGEVSASGENIYYISEKSEISMLIDEDNKKIIEIDAFNDNDDIIKVEYTLEKKNLIEWIITGEKGYLNVNVNDMEKQLYYYDEFSIMASSKLDDYPPINALDDNQKTAWAEGVEGSGIGEWLEFKASCNKEVSGIKIINGYAKSEDLYYDNNRVRKISIELPDNTIIEIELEDGIIDYQTIEFEKVVDVKNIKITILEAYPGNKYNDTCISEIKVYR